MKNNNWAIVGVILYCVLVQSCLCALKVNQCHNIETPIEDLDSKVHLSCKRTPCRLRKNTSMKLMLDIKPDKDVEKLVTSVEAYILNIPFPFPGVDQTDACNDIYKKDGVTKATCPLKAGEEYVYKNEIEVLEIYPRVKAVVHWGLSTADGDLVCFEIPIRITN